MKRQYLLTSKEGKKFIEEAKATSKVDKLKEGIAYWWVGEHGLTFLEVKGNYVTVIY